MKYTNKVGIILVSFLLLFSILIPLASAAPSIIIYDYELTPKIFMPGDIGTLKLTIKNAEATNTQASTTTTGSTSVVYTVSVGAAFNNIWLIQSTDRNGKRVKASASYEDTGYLSPSASFDITFDKSRGWQLGKLVSFQSF